MSKSWIDPGSQDSDFEEDLDFVPELDLNNFPDPSKFLPLVKLGIATEEDFIQWWKKRTGDTITRFESFSVPNPATISVASPLPMKKEENSIDIGE
jgi:hypothetical protein